MTGKHSVFTDVRNSHGAGAGLLLAFGTLAAVFSSPAALALAPVAPFLPGEYGALTYNGTSFTGDFINGGAPASGSLIVDLSIGGRATLEGVEVPGFVRTSAAAENGTLKVTGGNASLSLMDAPAAYMRLTLEEGATGTVTAAAPLEWVEGPESSLWLRGDSDEGLLWNRCYEVEWRVNGKEAALGPVPASCSLYFRASAQAAGLGVEALAVPLADGRIAAEASLWGPHAEVSTSTFHFTEAGEVAPITTDFEHVSLIVRVEEEGPRSVVLYFDGIEIAADSGPSVDGRPMVVAATASLAFDPELEGDEARGAYAVLRSGGTAAVVLTLDEAGFHLIDIPLASAGDAPQLIAVQPVTPGVAMPALALAAGLAVAAAAVLLLWRRPST